MAISPPVQLSMPTPSVSCDPSPMESIMTKGMLRERNSVFSRSVALDSSKMTPRGLRLRISRKLSSLRLPRPVCVMVMPMGIDFTYSEVSAIIALIPFAMTSVSTSSMVRDVFVVTRDLEYPDSSMIFSMRALVELDTPSRPLMTFDTVAVETPASFAISLTRGFFISPAIGCSVSSVLHCGCVCVRCRRTSHYSKAFRDR